MLISIKFIKLNSIKSQASFASPQQSLFKTCVEFDSCSVEYFESFDSSNKTIHQVDTRYNMLSVCLRPNPCSTKVASWVPYYFGKQAPFLDILRIDEGSSVFKFQAGNFNL